MSKFTHLSRAEATSHNRHHFEAFAEVKDLLGEILRSTLFLKGTRKHKLYSGLFVLLKLKLSIARQDLLPFSSRALSSFASLILPVCSFAQRKAFTIKVSIEKECQEKLKKAWRVLRTQR